MARSPIFREVRRALRMASRLEQTRTGTAEGLERLELARWDRRRFVRTTLAAAAGATLAPVFRASAKGPQAPKVVIVGAGTAGLVCAYRLQENGIAAKVIEASTRVGGRMFSLRNFFPDDQLTELGGEYIDSDHETMHRLVKELGLTLKDLSSAGKSGEEHAFFFGDRMVPVDEDFIDMFRPVAQAIASDLKKMKRGGEDEVDFETPHAGEIDRLSISEWLEKRGVTGLPADILRVAYVGEYGLEIDEQSSLNLLVTMGDDTEDDEFRPFGDSDERFHIVEGNDAVPTRFAEKLKTPVELGVHLESIASLDRGFRLGLRTDGGSREETADIVVLALPFTILRQIDVSVRLPESKRKAIKELGYGTNAKLIAGFSRRVWEEAHKSGYTFSDLPFQCCWETSRGQPGSHAILTNFLGGNFGLHLDAGDIPTRAGEFVSQIEKLYPGATDAFTKKAIRQHWPSSPFVRGSYTCYKPGQYSTLAGSVAEPVGNLFFAGEHTSEDFNGYMEGAAESGERAAKEVLAKVGVRS